MMLNNLNLGELRNLMAKLESRKDKLIKRRELLVAELALIEEELRKIDGDDSGDSSQKTPRGKAARNVRQPDVSTPVEVPKRRGRPSKIMVSEPLVVPATEAPKTELQPYPEPEPESAAMLPTTETVESLVVEALMPGAEPLEATAASPATPKRRGRPPKSSVTAPIEVVAAEAPNVESTPKTEAAIEPSGAVGAPEAPPKRRGRPPKSAVAVVYAAGTTEGQEPAPESEPEPDLSAMPSTSNLLDVLVQAIREAGRPLKFNELIVAAEKAGFAQENRFALIQESILSGPFRETVEGVMLRETKAPVKPLAGLLDE